MANEADEDYDYYYCFEDDGDIFIYRGGRAPRHVKHVRIDKSVLEIDDLAFWNCGYLVQVETHDGIRKVGKYAFYNCTSLGRLNLRSVVEIGNGAFHNCENLESVEFGDMLETIGTGAFDGCFSLTHLQLPAIVTIGQNAFRSCTQLLDIMLSERLETIGCGAFYGCSRLQCIAMPNPMKRDLFAFNDVIERYNQFDGCEQLTTVDPLVGEIHKTVPAVHMDRETNRINQLLSNTNSRQKTDAIRRWMKLLFEKERTSLLELALWKAKLGEKEEYAEGEKSKKAKVDTESARKERRITCGADMVIKNVLPFLQVEE